MSGESQCTAERPCTAVQLLVQRQLATDEKVDKVDERVDKVEEDLKAIRDRLPPWVLGVGTFGGILIGALGALASK